MPTSTDRGRLTITPPKDFVLFRDVCSYGYFLLAPNHWDPKSRTLSRTLDLPGGPAAVTIGQAPTRGGKPTRKALAGRPLSVTTSRRLDPVDRAEAKRQITRMLRLDEPTEHLAAFHKIDPRWKKSGQGRLFRSPTLFEDVIKTVTSCNVAWPSTIKMNMRLCDVLGPRPLKATGVSAAPAFPSAAKLARTRAGTLRARCGVGYRDQRIIDLAKLFSKAPTKGGIDQPWLENPDTPDDDVFKFLTTLPGIGPYAAGNIMQLLGRYSRLALDTESVRHGKAVLDMTGTDRDILKRVAAHFEPFGEHKFRSYWFELWQFYESKRGPAWEWDRETTGRTFTAAQLKD